MAGTIVVDRIESDSSYTSTINVASKVNFTSGMQIGGQDTTFGGMRNRIINGDMRIDQRNAGASFTNSNQSQIGLDRWRNYGLSGAVLTLQQSTLAPTGFANSQSVTVTTSTTANDSGGIAQRIEAHNVYDLAWGTSSGASVTASFWVRGSITGTYNFWVQYNGSVSSYYYVGTYTISASNTWEYKTVTIPAPPTAAGAFTAALNTQYMEVRFSMTSSGGSAVSANTWSTNSTPKSTGAVDLASNSGATWYVTGVQLEKGSAASAFEYRQYGQELVLCQRYYQQIDYGHHNGGLTANWYQFNIGFPVVMRTDPTMTTSARGSNTGNAITLQDSGTVNGWTLDLVSTTHATIRGPNETVSRGHFGRGKFNAEL